MALGSTEPPTEISTRGLRQPCRLTALWVCTTRYRDSLFNDAVNVSTPQRRMGEKHEEEMSHDAIAASDWRD
jgi:hypothetical protein